MNIFGFQSQDGKLAECLDGQFLSPMAEPFPELFPSPETRTCYFRAHLLKREQDRRGLVIILAPTGDHTFTLRERSFVLNLLERGVSSILVENPFYGRRKPPGRWGR